MKGHINVICPVMLQCKEHLTTFVVSPPKIYNLNLNVKYIRQTPNDCVSPRKICPYFSKVLYQAQKCKGCGSFQIKEDYGNMTPKGNSQNWTLNGAGGWRQL